nr:MAG TPA: hypothetical protein [Caudoviricetes sp.]
MNSYPKKNHLICLLICRDYRQKQNKNKSPCATNTRAFTSILNKLCLYIISP